MWSNEQYIKFHSDSCKKLVEITKKKNADYTGGGDPFKNFKMVEQFGALSTEQGFFTRMTDKLARISTFIIKGKLLVKDESVEDTLFDMANYCILMAGYLKSKREALKKGKKNENQATH